MSPRPASPEEAPGLAAIARAAYAPFIAVFGPNPPPMQQDFPGDIADGKVWVMGKPATGFIVLAAVGRDWLIENLAVDPAAQGAGAGRALMRFAEAEGRRRGHCRAVLYTSPLMTGTVAFYTKLGYREAAMESAEVHRIRLTKDL